MSPPRAAVGELDRPEELLLEPVGGLLVELLVRGTERGQRGGELVGRLRDGVEQLPARLGGGVRHSDQR